MIMKPEEFAKSLHKGEIGPLYYFHGDEPYLMEQGVKRLLSRTVSPDFRDFNLNVFYGKECKGDEIMTAAQTMPMFAEWRVVLVKRSSELSAAALEALTGYVADPAPSTCLIFEGEKIDQRKKFFVEIKKQGNLVEFKRLYENQLGPFIREEAAVYGKKLEAAALELLVYLVGNNLQELAAQVEKIATYVGARETVKVADIKEIVSDTKVDSIFELADALGGKDLGKALRSLNTILRDGEAPLMVMAMVTRHFRQLWKVRELCDRRVPSQEIGKAAGINPYFLKGILEQAKNYRLSELKEIFERLFETDLALKTSGGKPVSLMECLVMDICGKGASRRAS
jgi:DNA polymerase III subunit delta